jgi:hypothetical protein
VQAPDEDVVAGRRLESGNFDSNLANGQMGRASNTSSINGNGQSEIVVADEAEGADAHGAAVHFSEAQVFSVSSIGLLVRFKRSGALENRSDTHLGS